MAGRHDAETSDLLEGQVKHEGSHMFPEKACDQPVSGVFGVPKYGERVWGRA